MIETAIIALPFFLLLCGVFEFGLLFRDYLTIGNATTAGAREATASANYSDADFRVLAAIDKAGAALPRGSLRQIVVYKANGPDDSIANYPACTDADNDGVAGLCNHYTSADLELPETEFACGAGTPAPRADDGDWCPTGRHAFIDGVESPPDWIGIFLEVEYNFVSGIFGDQVLLTDEMVLRIEPQGVVKP